MQRHFSNRGEALAEVTAARMLARRKRSAQSPAPAQGARQIKAEQWFTKPAQLTQRPKKTQPKRDEAVPPLL